MVRASKKVLSIKQEFEHGSSGRVGGALPPATAATAEFLCEEIEPIEKRFWKCVLRNVMRLQYVFAGLIGEFT